MATIADGSNAYNPRREKLFHYLDKIKLFLLILPSLTSYTTGLKPGILYWTIFIASMATWAAIFMTAPRYHDEGMCTICSRTELLVLNEAATKHARALKSFHTYWNTTHTIIRTLRIPSHSTIGHITQRLLPLVLIFPLFMIHIDISGFDLPLGAIIALAIVIAFARMFKIHFKYQVWCPWCDHGRGDDDDTEPAPTPEPTGTEKITA